MRIRPFSLALDRPLATARGTIDTRDGFLVAVGRDPVGVGEATPLPGWTEPHGECRGALRRARGSLGDDERIREEAVRAALRSLADAPAARHGLALALADRGAKLAAEPLYRHLGAPDRVESVAVNATVGDGSVGETVSAGERAVADGFRALKVKVGARPVDADLDRVGAVRDAIGPDVELRVDANGAWSPSEAGEALAGLARLGISYVEQPLDAGDLHGHAALRGGPVGIALDETLASVPVEDVLDAGAADVLVLKPMVLGGVDRARAAAGAARDRGVEPVVTTTVDGAVARVAAIHLAASLPDPPACGLATADRLGDDFAPDPAPVSDGAIAVPQDNGNGVRTGWDA